MINEDKQKAINNSLGGVAFIELFVAIKVAKQFSFLVKKKN
jgi:hypothetical protein